MSEITRLLEAVQRRESGAADRLLSLVYEELRRMAVQKMSREQPGQTLQPTALLHEAWLRLAGKSQYPEFNNRAHFFAAAAGAMRRILVERARRRQAQRRGGGGERIDLDAVELAAPGGDEEVLAVHEALDRLAARDPAKCELVKLRYFAGLTIEQAAAALGVSTPTAKRWWSFARAWLYREITCES